MKNIKVLGSGCSKCIKTAALIESVAADNNCDVTVAKETSAEVMMSYGVMSTPAVLIDENLIHSGSIPTLAQIASWLK